MILSNNNNKKKVTALYKLISFYLIKLGKIVIVKEENSPKNWRVFCCLKEQKLID